MAEMSQDRARWALDALAVLPDGHPLRQEWLAGTRSMVRSNVETFTAAGEFDDALMALQSLLGVADTDDEADALIAEGEKLLPQTMPRPARSGSLRSRCSAAG